MEFLYDVVVAAFIKDEGPYLAEWLDYHERAGIDHFFLYDNDSKDDTAEILQPYIARGYVTYIPCHGAGQQVLAYTQAIRDWRYLCRYIAFIDAGEFIFPVKGGSIADIVHNLMDDNSRCAELTINLRFYGTSGCQEPSDGQKVLRKFLHRAKDGFHGNMNIKSIVNPRRTAYVSSPQFAAYYPGYNAYDTAGKMIFEYRNCDNPGEQLVLNHYVTESHDGRKERHLRGKDDINRMVGDEEIFEQDCCNEVFDDAIVHYLDSRPIRQMDYQERKKQYILKEIDRITEILKSKGYERYRLEDILQGFFDCEKLLSDYLDEGERRQVQRDLIECVFFKLAVPDSYTIWESYLLIDSLPDLALAEENIWKKHKDEIKSFIKRISDFMNHYAVTTRERFVYDYLVRLLD